MKRYTLFYYIAAAFLFLTTSCKDGNAFGDDFIPRLSQASDDVVEQYLFKPSATSLTFSAQAATQTVTIQTNTSFTVQVSDSWLSVTPTSGSSNTTLQVTAKENTTAEARTATISFLIGDGISFNTQSGSQTRSSVAATITVIQSEGAAYIIPETQSLSFTAEGSTQTVKVNTNVSYRYEVSYSIDNYDSGSWLTITPSADFQTLSVTASENTTSESRTTTIHLTYGISATTRSTAEATITVTQGAPDPLGLCPDNNHPHLIDLGLSVKWACCNVGASSPIEYGNYFAWGETSGYNSGKTNFEWSNYKWCNGSETTMTKYCNDSNYGTVDNKTQLELSDDAARANWGSPYRMPTIDEIYELINTSNCTWEKINNDGLIEFGYKVTSKTTGNRIFFTPTNSSLGNYWSSSLYTSSANRAFILHISGVGSARAFSAYQSRFGGLNVRPVAE